MDVCCKQCDCFCSGVEEYQADTVHDEITDVKCTYLAKELLGDDEGMSP